MKIVFDITDRFAGLIERLLAVVGNNEQLSRIERKIDEMSANLDAKLDDLASAIETEMQQLRDAIAAGQDAVAAVDRASTRIDTMLTALRSDDATPPAP